ncbi:MAG: hypothetical protein Q4D02_06515 [Clostridia bacterium]|nr:hypothetical protein [Clostridia bacterium]
MKKNKTIAICFSVILIIIVAIILIHFLNQKENNNKESEATTINWQTIYEEFILSDQFSLYSKSDEQVSLEASYIAFVDLDHDNIPELLQSTGDLYATGENLIHVFTIDKESFEVKRCGFNLFNTPVLYYNDILGKSFYVCESIYETHYNKRIVNSLDNIVNFSYYSADNTYYLENTEVEKENFNHTLNSYFDNAEKIEFMDNAKENIDGTFDENEKMETIQSAIQKYKSVEKLLTEK